MSAPSTGIHQLEETVDAMVQDQVLSPSGRVRGRTKVLLALGAVCAVAFSLAFPWYRGVTGHEGAIYRLELLSISIGVGALVYAYVITLKQDRQLLTLASISKTIGTEVSRRERIEKFFCVSPWGQNTYRCYFPAEYGERPLPSVLAGDYHALQVLSSALGSSLVLESVPRDSPAGISVDPKDNLIFLCAPDVNVALKGFIDALGVELPCWFDDDHGRRCLAITDSHAILSSGADDHYAAAQDRTNHTLPYAPGALVSDLGIMARITDGGRRTIILSGIHQYGTWIVAEFLEKLIRGEGDARDYESVFFGRDDFLAVVYGEFSHEMLRVNDAMISHRKVWVRTGGSWDLVEVDG